LTSDATTAPQLVIEPLLKENNKGEFTPWLAESYKLADDRMSITFTLRKGIQFHDGSNFDATVAKWNMDNQIAAKKTSTWASVDLIDQYTVRVNFTKWQNTNLSGFSGATSWMISKAAFDKNGLDWVRQNPIGTGPFKFVSFLKDTSFKTTRNTNYWRKDAQGNQLPYLNAVTFLFITDPVTQESAMKAGEADMLTVKHGSKVASDLAAVGFTVKSAAIDTSVLFGDTINADSPYDPNFSLYRKYDVAAAKQLLTDAGYPSGFTTSLIACPFNLNQDVVVAIQGYLAKVGIKADIQYPDAGKFTSDITLGKWKNGLVYEPIAGFPNYMTIFSALFNPVTNFHPSWLRTPEWLAAYSAAMAAPAPDAKLMRAFTDLMVKDDSMIPVNEGGRGWAYMSYVKDIGVLETQFPPYLNFENGWLDK
jgi:peptide/nickel transport system substrate-binding protein